jgi:hypothetical protein
MSLRHMSLRQAILGIATAVALSVTATAALAQTKPAVKDLGGRRRPR